MRDVLPNPVRQRAYRGSLKTHSLTALFCLKKRRSHILALRATRAYEGWQKYDEGAYKSKPEMEREYLKTQKIFKSHPICHIYAIFAPVFLKKSK